MDATAVVFEEPGHIDIATLNLAPSADDDVVVDVEWSGISTGTERLLWSGRMPWFPGMGYPLVPGYESVGRVAKAGEGSGLRQGERVFVPGAHCFGEVRSLFGGTASRLTVPHRRVFPIDPALAEEGILLALSATAFHVTAGVPDQQPDLIIGHGVLGRLLARLAIALGANPPVVWETNSERIEEVHGYQVIHPDRDDCRSYRRIVDASGDPAILDDVIARLEPGGEIVLAGFYDQNISFAFPPAFMREMRLRIAAQWKDGDLIAVRNLIESGTLSLAGLISHKISARQAEAAYQTAFTDPSCVKMVLDWSDTT